MRIAPMRPDPRELEAALAVALAAEPAAVAAEAEAYRLGEACGWHWGTVAGWAEAAAAVPMARRAVHKARQALVTQWTPWACKTAGKWYRKAGLGDPDEWCQAAVLGLMDAAGMVPTSDRYAKRRSTGPNAGRYDPASGYAFPTYAGPYVIKWLQEFAQSERSGCVRRPKGVEATPVLGFPAAPDGHVWEPAAREDAWADAPDADELWAAVDAVLGPRERMVVWLRFKVGYDLKRVGESLGVSRQRAQQIEAEALAKLREHKGGLAGFVA